MRITIFSWKLWRLLDVIPLDHPILKLMNKKSDAARLHPILIFFVIVALCIVSIFPLLLVPLGIALFCLRFSVRIAGDIAKQYEAGNYMLLAVTPVGGLGMALSISQLYSAGIRGNFKNWRTLVKVVGVVLALVGLSSMSSVLAYPDRIVSEFIEMLTLMLFTSLVIFAFVQEFMQSTILGVVVGMFAGSLGNRNTARLAAISLYLGIQFASYFLLVLLVAIISRFGGTFSIMDRSLEFMLIASFTALIYFGAREAVIYALWQQVLLRFNDDAPLRKSKIRQG